MENWVWKVLLVDSSEDDHQFLAGLLGEIKHHRYELLTAESIPAGLKATAENPIDLIIAAAHLGDGSGIQFLEAVRNQSLSDAPSLLLVEEPCSEPGRKAVQAGVVGCLVKAELTSTILESTIAASIDRVAQRDAADISPARRGKSQRIGLNSSGPPGDPPAHTASIESIYQDIFHLREVEESLRKTQELLERVFSTIYLGIAYMDRDFNFIRVNQTYAAWDGREETFFIGKNHFDLYPHAENEAIFRSVVETGEPYFAFEKPFDYPENPERGTTYWDWSLFPVKEADGAVSGVILTLLDVTQQAQARLDLQEFEARLHTVVDNAEIILWAINRDGVLTLVEGRGLARLNLSSGELVGVSVDELIVGQENIAEDIARALAGETVSDIVQVPQLSDEFLETHFTPQYNSLGEVAGVIGVSMIITERLEAEQRVFHQARLLETINDAVVASDTNWIITGWNRAAEQVFGWQREEVIGRAVDDIMKVEFSGMPNEEAIKELNRTGFLYVEGSVRRKDGVSIIIASKVSTITDEKGRVVGFVSINQDITRQKQAEEHAQRAVQRIERLAEFSRLLAEAIPDTGEVLRTIGRKTTEWIGDLCVVSLLSEDQQTMKTVEIVHSNPEAEKLWLGPAQTPVLMAQQGYRGSVIQTGKPLLISAFQHDGSMEMLASDVHPFAEQYGIHSLMIAPVLYRRQVIGILWVSRGETDAPYTKEELQFLEDLAYQAGLAISNSDLYQRARSELIERRRIEADLIELQSHFIHSVEDERLQLAQDLHDGPMQELYGLTYQLELLKGASDGEALDDEASSLQDSLHQIIQELRVIAGELRPPTLMDFGLEKAIRSHAEQLRSKFPDLEIELDLAPDRQALPEALRLGLFRIYQVCITNIIRHAKARQTRVRFSYDAQRVNLEIQDDGCGFRVPKRWVDFAREGHFGLVGAIERVQAYGGKMEVISNPGEGTLIRVSVPIPKAEPEA